MEEKVARFNNDDVIAVIFGLMGDPNQPVQFKGQAQDIHPAVFGLRDQYPLLRGFAFDQSGPFPFSRLLESILGRLELALLIRRSNPDFKLYILGKKGKDTITKRVLVRFNTAELAQLQEIASELAQLLEAA